VQLKAAIDDFFREFSKFEMSAMGTALRSLSQDAEYVEQTEKLLDFEARLTLLLRLSAARGVPPALAAELEAIVSRARVLRTQRDEIAQHLMAAGTAQRKLNSVAPPQIRVTRNRKAAYARLAESHDVLLPSLGQIQAYAAEAMQLQTALSHIALTLDEQVTAGG
jgi:hypothetical protein